MVIDFHAHLFPDEIADRAIQKLTALNHLQAFSDGTAAGLRASMRAAGVDLTVVLPVATTPQQVPHINDSAARLNQAGEGLFSFGCIHPDFSDWKQELDRIAALGLKGVKLHPAFQDTDLDDPRYLRILERAGALGLVAVTHTGMDVGMPGLARCTPQMARNALRQVGPVRLVLAHMGGWRCWEEAEELLTDTAAYLDTSFSLGRLTPLNPDVPPKVPLELLDQTRFLRMAEQFGAGRILFGSDSPWGSPAADLAWLRGLPMTEEVRTAILGENARRLLDE